MQSPHPITLPLVTLTKTEEDLVAEVLRQNPILLKYYKAVAQNMAVDIAVCPIEYEEKPEEYIRKQYYIKGQLALLEQLASQIVSINTQE